MQPRKPKELHLMARYHLNEAASALQALKSYASHDEERDFVASMIGECEYLIDCSDELERGVPDAQDPH